MTQIAETVHRHRWKCGPGIAATGTCSCGMTKDFDGGLPDNGWQGFKESTAEMAGIAREYSKLARGVNE